MEIIRPIGASQNADWSEQPVMHIDKATEAQLTQETLNSENTQEDVVELSQAEPDLRELQRQQEAIKKLRLSLRPTSLNRQRDSDMPADQTGAA